MRTEVVYMNTLDVAAYPNATATARVLIPTPVGFSAPPLVAAWELGLDSNDADTPGIRVSVQLQVGLPGVAGAPIGDYLYRSPGRSLRGSFAALAVPYALSGEEVQALFIKITNGTPSAIDVRASAYVWFVAEDLPAPG